MRHGRIGLIALAVLLGIGLWVASSVTGADDERRQGDVIDVQQQADGTTDISRQQPDGEIIVEHQEPGGEVWFESNEVMGHDGKPVICPDGTPLRVDIGAEVEPPSASSINEAQRGLPAGKRAVFNQYTGEFEVVNGLSAAGPHGEVVVTEPLLYECNARNEPRLVPLSTVDPQAGQAAQREMARQIRNSEEITGLGTDPARTSPPPKDPRPSK